MASKWFFSLKATLISASVLTTAVMIHLSLPTLLDLFDSEIPYLPSIITASLKPPYLYILLNCIILTIAASTKLHPPKIDSDLVSEIVLDSPFVVPVPIKAPEDLMFADSQFSMEDVAVGAPVVFGYVEGVADEESLEATMDDEIAVVEATIKEEMGVIDGGEAENEVPRSDWTLPPRYPVSGGNEKPLVSRRFNYRRSGKASPEGGKGALGVSKPKRQDTLESTWRMITEGRPMPLTRHLKKSDTLDSHHHSPPHLINKSDTFHDRTNSDDKLYPGGGSGRLRKEPSLSQDELNKRVEAFIKKFNEEMRLQRQESLQQYSQMVGGGHHFQN